MADLLAVYLGGVRAGTLTRVDGGRITFEYDERYRRSAHPTPLSLSLPLARPAHGPDVVEPWVDNLLPDNDDVRQRWAASFGERRPTAFNLLRHTGQDCAGAVQIAPVDVELNTHRERTYLNESQIAAHLRQLRADDASWSFERLGGRWSLGGQQGKFALGRDEAGWYLPVGREPSTHIFKIGVASLARSDLAEYVTMRAARHLGLTVAPVALEQFEDQAAVVVTRFDRRRVSTGKVRRLHQEDMCQAMGLWRASKYESDGGPSASDVSRCIESAADPGRRESGLQLFAQAAVFNWVTAGTDAHAKNYGLLHAGSRRALAPLYDLLSAALVMPEREVQFHGKLAMKFGGEYSLRKVSTRHIARAAADLRVSDDWLMGTAREYVERAPDAFAAAVVDAGGGIASEVGAAFVDAIARRAHLLSVAVSSSTDG